MKSVSNYCSNMTNNPSMCEPHQAQVSVFVPMQPIAIASANMPLQHGTVNSGGLVVSLDSAAPASGMTIKVSSPNSKVKFANAGQASSNPAFILVPATKVSVDFDLDAKSLGGASTVTVSVVNKNDPLSDKKKIIQVQIR